MNRVKTIFLFLVAFLSILPVARSANNVFLNTQLVCFEDYIDIDLNDFCGNYREIINYDNDNNLTNLAVTFNPIAMGAAHNLSFEIDLPAGTSYLIRDDSGVVVSGVTNSQKITKIYESKLEAFPTVSSLKSLVNTNIALSSASYKKGKIKTIFLWFDPALPPNGSEKVNFSNLIQIRNKSLSPEQVYNYQSVTNGVRNMALMPFGKPIPPERAHFFDALVDGVSGSDIELNSSQGMRRPSDCDPRILNNDIGCREVLSQFLSSEDNVSNPGKNIDIGQAAIPETAVPEISPVNVNGDRLNINDHLDQIMDLSFVQIQTKSHCELYSCSNNGSSSGLLPVMSLDSPAFNNSNSSVISFTVENVLDGDTVTIFSDQNCTNQEASGVVTGNSISFSLTGLGDGSYNYYFKTVNLNSQTSECYSGITYNKTGNSLSGTVTYDYVPISYKLNYDETRQEPIRNADIKLFSSSDNSLVATGVTDQSGKYSFSVPSSGNYYWIIYASMTNPSVSVNDNTNNNAQYAVQSSVQAVSGDSIYDYNAPSGWGGTSYSSARVAAPFAILDSIYFATELIIESRPSISFPHLQVNWSKDNVSSSSMNVASGLILTSHYNPSTKQLYILGKENSDTDEYDRHIIVHEWSHYFEDNLSRSDSMGGSHSYGEVKDMSLSFGEGFATAISGIVFNEVDNSANSINSYRYGDSYGPGQAYGYQFNMEDGSDSNPGWYSEASVIQILFDLADTMTEAHDTLEKSIGDIMDVMTGGQMTTPARTSIFSFLNHLKSNLPDDQDAIDSITTDKNIEPVIDDFATSEDNFAGWGSMSNIYEDLVIDGNSIVGLRLGGNAYLYNDMKNNRYIKFQASSSSTSLYFSAANTGHRFYLGVYNKGVPFMFNIGGSSYENVGSVNGALGFNMPTTVGETYIVRLFSSTSVSTTNGEMSLTVTGVNQ